MREESNQNAEAPLLTIENLSKRFGSVTALNAVSMTMRAGQIYGLAGENGAGKSTLVKLLSGVHRVNEGQVQFAGRPYRPESPAAAERAGISVFHQEIPVCLNLSVAANIFLGPDLPRRGWRPDWRQMEEEAERCFQDWLGMHLDPRRLVRDCTIAERQLVLLVRVLRRRARLIILDEPTTALTPAEVSNLFVIARRLKSQGVTLVLISHLLDELIELADQIFVLRDGNLVGQLDRPHFDPQQLANLIAGRVLVRAASSAPASPRPCRLEVRRLSRANEFEEVSFDLAAGEILGIAGAQGSGRSAVGRALFAAPPPDRGQIILNGHPLVLKTPRDAMRSGIGYVPEDRKTLGLFQNLNIRCNLGLLRLKSATRCGLLAHSRLETLALELQQRLRIKMAAADAPIASLSGGNQQKVLIARWLTVAPQALVLNEPTRGVDVGAKDEIWRILRTIAAEGTAFVVVSSDLDELLQLTDRILVMTQGRLTATFPTAQASKAVLVHAIGQRRNQN